MAERNCDKCIHHIGGACSKWKCEFQTLADHDRQIRDEVIKDIISKIDDEYYDGGYGDYHEVAMIVRMLEQMRGEQNGLD